MKMPMWGQPPPGCPVAQVYRATGFGFTTCILKLFPLSATPICQPI